MIDTLPAGRTIGGAARRIARLGAMMLALAGAGGCAAVSAISSASKPLPAYALTPVGASGPARGSRHIVVELPTASGAIATDRILVKPTPLQAAYLPAARWVDPVPAMVQTLLVQSLQSSGAFRLVGRAPLGLFPDNTVLTEIRAFQAEPDGEDYRVRIALTLTLIRESDGAIIAGRNIDRTAVSPTADPLSVAAAFDAAMGSALREAVAWIANGGTGA
ncbi:ABC-type transport auxiliary lipoprotein family protein [Amaricoccus sp.]|uniref:ABC-type transport auxiliary lipoprotein family protein n=1 Tax=Amaricoccus sp. TaxID=1872485 RepID=UPI001B4F38C2|nr:ABC-type transport auxiliary lipoprotein family protein [Amaricoccus sp.]MBP7242752.1 membrane integrity-associated transporter subunit PqiC [Amaricoccus sp.]